MALSDISRQAILLAVAEYDSLGQRAFLKKYGFGRAKEYLLIVDGREYDSKAIVGAAHGYQFPDIGPLRAEKFNGGAATVQRLLESIGFEMRIIQMSGPEPAVDFALPDEIVPLSGLLEGAVRTVTVNAYERSPEARRRCIAAHGTDCCICGFSFGAVYGAEADGYIHVHHLRPLSEIGKEYEVNPIEDLRPVCPNCHAVLHLGDRNRNIEEVRHLLMQKKIS